MKPHVSKEVPQAIRQNITFFLPPNIRSWVGPMDLFLGNILPVRCCTFGHGGSIDGRRPSARPTRCQITVMAWRTLSPFLSQDNVDLHYIQVLFTQWRGGCTRIFAKKLFKTEKVMLHLNFCRS